MAFARLCTSDYIFKNTVIDKNVDPELINKFINHAQDISIQTVLGYNLYQKLMNDIITSGAPTGPYLTLLTDYIQRALALWVVYHSLPFINYHLTNKSVSEKSSDNDTPTQLSTVQYLRENVKNDAEFYSVRIREFIINNQGDYPEYFQYGPNRLEITPRPENYFNGIYLPRASNWGINGWDPAFPRC